MGVNKVSSMIMNEIMPRLNITSADARLTYANLLSYAQRVYEDLYYSIAAVNPYLYGQIGYVQFYANSTSATLSANLTDYDSGISFLKAEFKSDTNGDYYVGRQIDWQDITSTTATFLNTNPVYTIYGDKMYLKPEVTANVASCGKIYFTKRASALSGTATTDLPYSFEEAFIDGVCSHGYSQLNEASKSNEWLTKYQMAKEKKLREIAQKSKTSNRIRSIEENYFGTY